MKKQKVKNLFVVVAFLCLAAPAVAVDWQFYGSSRMGTWRTSNAIGNPVESDDDTSWSHQDNSRIGASVQLTDQIGGVFEMGESFDKRKLYGTYTFGDGVELLIGQTYSPSSSQFYSTSVYATDGDLRGVGQHHVGRVSMLQWRSGGLKIALIEPDTSAGNPVGNDDAVYGVYNADGTITAGVDGDATGAFVLTPETGTIEDIDSDLPKIEVAYTFRGDMFFAEVFGGYQSYTADGADRDYDIDSYVVGLGGGVTLGPVFFNAGAHMGQNLGNYGSRGFTTPDNATTEQGDANAAGKAGYSAAADEIIDNDGLGFLAVLGFNISEMFTIETGYGYMAYELDTDNAKSDTATQYYLNCTVRIAPGVFIVPEVGKIDYEKAESDNGDVFYYGAKWQIDF